MNSSAALLSRHRAFWQRSPVDRPLLSLPDPAPWPPLQIPVPAGLRLPPEGYLAPDMLDPEAYHGQMIARWQGLGLTEGDQFRIMTACWYVPWLEAICGCPIWYVQDSGRMYAMSPGGEWEGVRNLRLAKGNPWLQKLREFCAVLRDLCATTRWALRCRCADRWTCWAHLSGSSGCVLPSQRARGWSKKHLPLSRISGLQSSQSRLPSCRHSRMAWRAASNTACGRRVRQP